MVGIILLCICMGMILAMGLYGVYMYFKGVEEYWNDRP